MKLLLIGYGFRDDYINRYLYDALCSHENKQTKLKIYIITTDNPEDFKERLTIQGSNQIGIVIWDSVEGYFQYKLSDILRRNENHNYPDLDEIYNVLNT